MRLRRTVRICVCFAGMFDRCVMVVALEINESRTGIVIQSVTVFASKERTEIGGTVSLLCLTHCVCFAITIEKKVREVCLLNEREEKPCFLVDGE